MTSELDGIDLQLLLPDLERAKGARCVVVGSITGTSNTIGGGFVYPRAEIGELKGLKKGGGRSSEMVDGGKFDDAAVSRRFLPPPPPRSRSMRCRVDSFWML